MSARDMAYWNYRVVKRTVAVKGGEEDYDEFFIVEAYYDDADALVGWLEPVAPAGDTFDELCQDMTLMQLAALRPVLDYGSLPPETAS